MLSFIASHPPRGAKESAHGNSGAPALRGKYVEFSSPGLPEQLEECVLVIDVVALPYAAAAVRADAEVQWTIPRPVTERVPLAVRRVDITRSRDGRAAALSVEVNTQAKVRAIVGWFDQLPTVQPGIAECPASRAMTPITLTFRGRRDEALTEARYPVEAASVCDDATSFTIRGAAQTPLVGGAALLHKISRLPGITLPSSR